MQFFYCLHNSTFPVRGSGSFDFFVIHGPDRISDAKVLLNIFRHEPGKGGDDHQCNHNVKYVLGAGYIDLGCSHCFAPLKKGPGRGTVPVARPFIKFFVQYNLNISAPVKSSLFFLTLLSPRYASTPDALPEDIFLRNVLFAGPVQCLLTDFAAKTIPADVLFRHIRFAAPSTISL